VSAQQGHNSNQAFTGAVDDDAKKMPFGAGEQIEAGIDPLANVAERKKLNTGSLVIVFVIVLAAAGLWSMRKFSHVSGASGRSSDVEAEINKFLQAWKGESASRTSTTAPSTALTSSDTVLSVLAGTYTQRQVPLTDVQRNPFILPGDNLPTAAPVDDGSKALAKRQADRKAQIEQAASHLQLKSIIMGSVPLANISGKLVHKDDNLVIDDKVTFRVVSIATDSITLVVDDVPLDLSVAITLNLKR
jgi:hypothetical protein